MMYKFKKITRNVIWFKSKTQRVLLTSDPKLPDVHRVVLRLLSKSASTKFQRTELKQKD